MTDTYLTRKTLLNRLKSRTDEQSWEEFVFYYENFIRSIINKMGVNPSDFDDLSQQVTLKVWNSIEKFDFTQKKASFRNWIYTITRHTVLTFIAQNKYASRKREEIGAVEKGHLTMPEIDNLIDEEWNKHISTLAFNNISKKVSAKAMDVFTSQFSNEPPEVTAERLGLDKKTVYIYRARIKSALTAEIKNLKEMLE